MVHAEVPAHELSRYPIDLRSVSHGTGTFTRRFVRYDYLPTALARELTSALSSSKVLEPVRRCGRGPGESASGASSPIAYAPSSACRARGIRSGVSVCRLSSG